MRSERLSAAYRACQLLWRYRLTVAFVVAAVAGAVVIQAVYG